MDLNLHYDQLYKTFVRACASGSYEIDPWLLSETDDRFGLSLVLRPSKAVKIEIQKFLDDLKFIEPQQYFYPSADIHITVISLISCYGGLKLSHINFQAYVSLVEKCMRHLRSTYISCRGITASPSCLMVQGFPDNDSLSKFRNQLRQDFRNSELEQSMDERYLIQTAHATVFRFREPLQDTDKFLKVVERYKNHNFGHFEVKDIELVYNDWYHRKNSRQTLHVFELSKMVR